jgi:hypothetical protein
MKKHTIQALALALVAVVLLGSCDLINDFIAGRTRNIALIQIYNSNHEKTNKLQPNDTLYVEVQGLAPLGYYKVEALDPSNNPITMMTAQADENGVIVPTPLWYDIGFKKVTDDQGNIKAVLPTDSELGLNAFNIHVVSLEEDAKALTMTDFKLPFFVVYKTDISRPQPIVMAGKNVPVNLSSEFVLENAYDSGEELWIKVANLETLLETDDPETTDMTVYLVPFDAGYYEDGYLITSNFVARQTFTVKQLREGVKFSAASETWTGIGAWDPIPASAEGHSFSVILDVDNNGLYDVLKDGTDDFYLDGIDGNGVPGFIVRQTVAPFPLIDYIPGNVASGGISWGHFFFEDWPDPDYRDQFYADGMDTLPVWGWQDYVGWTIDYGIKALWNPYVDKDIDDTPNTDNTLYYGRWVNLYIVESSTLDLTGTLELTPATGTRMLYMPVQYACTNGANLQTIWKAPMAVGKYSVVVDIDMNNKVSKGDLVDNVMENGAINADGKTGFEVIAR